MRLVSYCCKGLPPEAGETETLHACLHDQTLAGSRRLRSREGSLCRPDLTHPAYLESLRDSTRTCIVGLFCEQRGRDSRCRWCYVCVEGRVSWSSLALRATWFRPHNLYAQGTCPHLVAPMVATFGSRYLSTFGGPRYLYACVTTHIRQRPRLLPPRTIPECSAAGWTDAYWFPFFFFLSLPIIYLSLSISREKRKGKAIGAGPAGGTALTRARRNRRTPKPPAGKRVAAKAGWCMSWPAFLAPRTCSTRSPWTASRGGSPPPMGSPSCSLTRCFGPGPSSPWRCSKKS